MVALVHYRIVYLGSAVVTKLAAGEGGVKCQKVGIFVSGELCSIILNCASPLNTDAGTHRRCACRNFLIVRPLLLARSTGAELLRQESAPSR